ncbi:hypothetical protein MBM_06749 [Drepanopeziza brunnea f. sp. 'multigermtubi' MB_m1]|uniref:Uncharacterized protein n=1 Tax=Marssonina brunnea f. sp. multigermtubi (strain MB_m1) TaxID=1072389 RepID=K1X2H6_MARBU|nr:uncharacterized protein MBM_06749 [Drepanopeziza brunnea f. sp. 'multigermtubi' MB_m1]EKD14988.1 hypothetical protein MBM_06749 [Drepanopeziza brunnea f. sp. 'multigermtubi' MB_m1]
MCGHADEFCRIPTCMNLVANGAIVTKDCGKNPCASYWRTDDPSKKDLFIEGHHRGARLCKMHEGEHHAREWELRRVRAEVEARARAMADAEAAAEVAAEAEAAAAEAARKAKGIFGWLLRR